MKAYKVEVLVLDHECVGEDGVVYFLENVKYLYPKVMSIQSKEIGEWDYDNPLNRRDEACREYYEHLFGDT
jgi:hypothetical protein